SVVQRCCDFLKKEFVQLRFDLQNYCLLCTVAHRYGMKDLQEAAESKMALKFKDTCENEEFLSIIEPDQLVSLLSRDDLCAPSETFIFKSVMQWIKHKKEERMAVAAKVIGAVRLGLVDIRVVIEELNTEEMQRDPEIHRQLHETSLYNNMPSCSSKFAEERSKPRSASQALVAIVPQAQMKYFDVENKTWKTLSATLPSIKATRCYSAVSVGNIAFVAGVASNNSNCLYQYDTENNIWKVEPLSSGGRIDNSVCIVDDYIYVISSDSDQVPQRYNMAKMLWQSISKPSKTGYYTVACNNLVVVYPKVFVLYSNPWPNSAGQYLPSVLQCFDPTKNEWEQKATTCHPHFRSSLLVVNGKIFLAGGFLANNTDSKGCPYGNPAPIEIYNEETNTWSVVEQKHIPANNLNAAEIEGRVYFIINKFPIDSGIRISPGELYPVPLGEWENLGNIDKSAALCYLPLKREFLKTD
ncbi:kelch-like protein 12, partial [Stylophora pistillata]|uniref:kelch-like protein 12 n=1 Tax=Stylophora pistillata TaxID=50429 RepID=UPI000C04AB33